MGESKVSNVDEIAAIVNTVTQGHPMFVVATLRELQNSGWDATGIEDVQYTIKAGRITDDTLQALLNSITEAEARELLYRLAIILGEFDRETLLAVARTLPELNRPLERAMSLGGLWLDQASLGNYSVSPLIRPLAETELDSQTVKNVCMTLAGLITSRRRLSVLDVANAVHYFDRGGNLNRAALFLLFILNKAESLPRQDLEFLMELAWGNRSLPNSVKPSVGLMLRASQMEICRILNISPEAVINEGEKLCKDSRTDSASQFCFRLKAIFEVAEIDYPRSCSYLNEILLLQGQLPIKIHAEPFELNNILWINTSGIKSPDDLLAWLNLVDDMADDQRDAAFAWEEAERGAHVALSFPWTAMSRKETTSKEWENLFSVYSHAAELGKKLSIEVLWASAIRWMIVIQAENFKDISKAEEIANEALRRKEISPSSRFLIEDILGRQYLYNNQNALAKQWLTKSLQSPVTAYPWLRAWTYLELAGVIGDENPSKAVEEIEKSVQLCHENAYLIGEAQMIRSLGELGIARWNNDDIAGCFDAFEEATSRALDGNLNDDERDGCIVRLQHALGYFSSVAVTGKPPSQVRDGGEYAPPSRRWFLDSNQILLEWYREQDQTGRGASLCAILAGYAEIVGRDDLATLWAIRGIDEAREFGCLPPLGGLGQQVFSSYFKKDSYAIAIDVIRESTLAMRASTVLAERGDEVMLAGQSADKILNESDKSVSQQAELWAIQSGIIPLFLHIGKILATNPDEAKEHVAEIVDSIKDIAERTYYPDAWNAIVDFTQSVFFSNVNWQVLKGSADEWESKSSALRMLGYLMLTLSLETPLEVSACCHVVVAQYILNALSLSGRVRRLLEEFLVVFWQNTFMRQRFRFVSPDFFEANFQEALDDPTEKRLFTILQSVISGSGARSNMLSEDTQQWLYHS